MVEPAITQIVLTQKEKQIFETLLSVLAQNQLKTTLRVAGGWVRDKVSLSKIHNGVVARQRK